MSEDAFCRDCLQIITPSKHCFYCRSPRIVQAKGLFSLCIAHMDCDAFYASVEKRDNPDLRNKPVIIGGGTRGVVSTACYIARIKGIRSAMPMFQARKLCPDAVIIKPRMSAYKEVSDAIRHMMLALSPNVEPLSLDEAFIDLSGTYKLHGEPPAIVMARLIKQMETNLGISGSVGLSYNKFLAKMASDMDKPRGYSVIPSDNIIEYLAPLPINLIWGVGTVTQNILKRSGIHCFGDLQRKSRKNLIADYGTMGDRLWHLCQGKDYRTVAPQKIVKSISKEITFENNIRNIKQLDGYLWRLSEQVSDRAKAKATAGRVITLKVKSANFKSLTRRVSLRQPTQLANKIYAHARPLLNDVITHAPFRLIGIGISELHDEQTANNFGDLLAQSDKKYEETERAIDKIKKRFGKDAIKKGRSLR